MKIHGRIKIGNKPYQAGDDVPWLMIYPFFLFHMLIFGASGFFMAYADKGSPLLFLYAHGGIAIFVYTLFYFAIFGRDEIKWLFINTALGFLGIYSQIGWLLSLWGKKAGDYPWYVHVIPFLYFVLYTFLLRHAILDMAGVRENETRRKIVEFSYVAATVAVYLLARHTA
jgi:hypothetical protein